jgi:DNA-binding LacI/PurR family transcriptional regulator
MPRKQSIIQIAKRAGVAPSTVSRVINNHPDVSPETYQKVKKEIDRLGFMPNVAARSLASKRSYTIAMVTSDLVFYPNLILARVEDLARKRGYKLFVNVIDTEFNPPSPQDNRLLETLIAYQVDGIIWSVQEMIQSFELWNERLLRLNIPIVCISARNNESLSSVSVDNRQGGHLAAMHLHEQGYRNIGTITGPMQEIASLERLTGWKQGLEEAGLTSAPNQIIESDWTAADGERSFIQLYRQFPKVDAVFVQNDQMALGVYSAINHLGLRIPDQIGIVGFDNRNEAALYMPPLTSVNHHFDKLGLQAVEEIDRLIKLSPEARTGETPKTFSIQPELVIRQSSVR